MEHKTWLWRRRTSEKTITSGNKSDLTLAGNEEKKDKHSVLERTLEDLEEQLSSVRTESTAKDELLAKQAKVAQEAIAGWEKVEAEAESFKQELDDALVQKAAAEARIANIDTSLKECMQQLHVTKKEHQHMMHDAVMKISAEQEQARRLEKRLVETNSKLAKQGVENSNLSRILELKEKLIEDLSNSKSQSEADFTAIVARLDSSEKENDSLKYEVCMLQKELEIRNQDRDFHLKSADAAHRQYLETANKITRLESECQRLRVMLRKRLPGPAAIAKMRNEVDMLGNGVTETRKNKTRSVVEAVTLQDFGSKNGYASSKRLASLVERLNATEDENKVLKETVVKRSSELQSSRIMFARTASKLSQAETQLEELSKGQVSLELARTSPMSYDLPLASISEDGGNEDTVSCAESWASALISELEHFRNSKPTATPKKTAENSELSLMDDFVEMEKLAIVCVDGPSESSNISFGDTPSCLTPKEFESQLDTESTGQEIVPLNLLPHFSERNQGIQSSCTPPDNHPGWLQDILQVIVQKHHSTGRSLDVILEEIGVALGKGDTLYSLCIQTSSDPCIGEHEASRLKSETSKKVYQRNSEKPLLRLIELIEGIIQKSTSNRCQEILAKNDGSNTTGYNSSSLTAHVARVFLWEISELSVVLQHFLIVCNDLLHRKANFENFASELASTLDWIINHCFSLQDVSTMKEAIKNFHREDEALSDNELESGITEGKPEALEELNFKVRSSLSLSTTSNGVYILSQMESKTKDENTKLRYEIKNMESTHKDLKERLKSACTENESLSIQLKEAGERISYLQAESAAIKDLKGLIEDQIINQKLITEDLGSQLTVAKAKLNMAHQKFSSLEVELEDKSNCCDELEATCLDLQLQLESVSAKETPTHDKGQEDKQLRTDWEISAASEKLAQCQATILNLGKQLKVLAAPEDAALLEKVISSPTAASTNRLPRLFNQIQTEDETRSDHLGSPKTKEIICTQRKQPPTSPICTNNPNAGLLYGRKMQTSMCLGANNSREGISEPSPVKLTGSFHKSDEPKQQAEVGRLVLVPKRQKGGATFLRKLLSRRKKDNSKRLALTVSS